MENNYKTLTDQELESMWQLMANNIQEILLIYYKTKDEKYRSKAEFYQDQQSEIQTEITRRH